MLQFESVRYFDVHQEIEALGIEHYSEIGQADMAMNIHHGYFVALDRLGQLVTIVARKDGQMVGYMVFVVQPFPHYRDYYRAVNDAIFMTKAARTGRSVMRFIQFAEETLKSAGVKKVFFGSKFRKDFTDLMIHIGYDPVETIVCKTLN